MSEVLALKYRPRSFSTLIGQESVSTTLSLALDKDRLSHAYLFSGLRGSGKTSTARIFAKALVCEKGPTSKPCEKCSNCESANNSSHIDIIEMDGASSRKIDDIRELIEHTKYKPSIAKYKIFIIDEVHMLTKEAFNALLKTLEEPPSFVKFILATTDPLKLPVTILSRTQHFRFKKISVKDVVEHLVYILNNEAIEFEKEALTLLARSGSGSLRDTLTTLDQAILYSKGYIDVKSITSMLGLLEPSFIEDIFVNILASKRDYLLSKIPELEEYEPSLVLDEFISYLESIFKNQDSRFPFFIVERFFRILSEGKHLLFMNQDSSFVIYLTIFKMIEATKVEDINESITKLENVIAKEDVPQTQITQETPVIQEEQKVLKIDSKELFKTLIKKLYDRNYDLGECFENYISFISYEENTLSLLSSVEGECKEKLRHSSSIIKHFTQEVFGVETKLSISKDESTKEQEVKKKTDLEENNTKQQEINAELSSSCISANLSKNDSSKIINPEDILEDSFIKKAVDLFDISKIEVKQKV